jgi:large subunit ribosomal protein L5
MYEFFDRLISVVIPRIRDFRGFSAELSTAGNYSLGLTEQLVFPEIAVRTSSSCKASTSA